MLIFKKINDLEKHLSQLRRKKLTTGFTPTMGALHAGHLSLLAASKKACDVSICSIFVNPTQFNDKADFEKYPSTLEKDIEMLTAAGCDVLFTPSVKEMYPDGGVKHQKAQLGFIGETLEGAQRPGHFNGVVQIMKKLLGIVKPSKLFMGQKDYQQQLIIGALIGKMKLKTKLVMCPTEREKDGLAMSSRNVRLSPAARKLAVEISKTLKGAKTAIHHPKSSIARVEEWGLKRLSGFKGIEPEYFQIRNAATLKPSASKSEKLIALAAVKIDGVRLIDNMVLE